MSRRASQLCDLFDDYANFGDRALWLSSWKKDLFLFHLDAARLKVLPTLHRLPATVVVAHRRTGWQKAVSQALSTDFSPHLWVHLRKCTDHWPCDLPQGHRWPRFLGNIRIIASNCPPRVQVSYLRFVCNGVCTRSRFQDRGSCWLCGCKHSRDSIRHYPFCSFVRRCFQKVALVPPSNNSLALDWFLGFWCPSPDPRVAHIIKLSLALYSLYRVHGSSRHGQVNMEDLAGAFAQFHRFAGAQEDHYERLE